MKKSLLFQLVMATALALGAGVARADLYSASKAFQEKDYERSFQLYRELAELGQVNAQENLAVMYVSGEGVKRDNVAGYAWAVIARENGGGGAMQDIIDQLEPHMTDAARKRIDGIMAQFAKPALESRLLPKIFESANYVDRKPCHLSKQAPNSYPRAAIESGIQGNVYMEFTVMPDGRARNPRVVFAVPSGVFDDAARRMIMRSEFSPSTQNGVPVPCTTSTMVMYVLQGVAEKRILRSHIVHEAHAEECRSRRSARADAVRVDALRAAAVQEAAQRCHAVLRQGCAGRNPHRAVPRRVQHHAWLGL